MCEMFLAATAGRLRSHLADTALCGDGYLGRERIVPACRRGDNAEPAGFFGTAGAVAAGPGCGNQYDDNSASVHASGRAGA